MVLVKMVLEPESEDTTLEWQAQLEEMGAKKKKKNNFSRDTLYALKSRKWWEIITLISYGTGILVEGIQVGYN